MSIVPGYPEIPDLRDLWSDIQNTLSSLSESDAAMAALEAIPAGPDNLETPNLASLVLHALQQMADFNPLWELIWREYDGDTPE